MKHNCIFDVPANQFTIEMVLVFAKEMGITEISHKNTSENLHYFHVSVDDPEKLIKFGMKLGLESVW